MCGHLEYSNKIANKLMDEKCKQLFYKKCLERLIMESTEFQHYLCYHKNINNYKDWLYYLLGWFDLFLLEEMHPYVLRIERISNPRCADGHYEQFKLRRGSEKAIEHEIRIAIRQLLNDKTWIKLEKWVRHKAENGTEFGGKMLRKINEVKKAMLAPGTVGTEKGICMMVKLHEFVEAIHGQPLLKGEQQEKDALLLKSIENWWPNQCDRKDEAESVFKQQRAILHEQKRNIYSCFMTAWQELRGVRGAPTRLHKFLQMTEDEIEMECTYNGKFRDSEVFRSHAHLKMHYIDAILMDDRVQSKAMKLAADISVWVIWLEKRVLDLAAYKTKTKLPRLTMAWEQNRWYYEMVYDQLFDIEEEAELAKKERQIGILLQMSKDLVEQKLKMPDEKLKIEFRSKKLERLKQCLKDGTAPPPPSGTVDREWHEIRRKSEEGNGQMGGGGEAVEKWLQQRHFEHIKKYLSFSYSFNTKLLQKSLSKEKLHTAELVGEENADEIYKTAMHYFGRLKKSDECTSSDDEGQNNEEKPEKNGKEKQQKKNGKNSKNAEEKALEVDKIMELMNLGEDTKKSKTPKESGGTKNKQKTKTPQKKGKKNGKENSLKIELAFSGKTASTEEAENAEAKKQSEEGTEIFLTPREEFSDKEGTIIEMPKKMPDMMASYLKNLMPKGNDDEKGILNSKSEKEKPPNGNEEKIISKHDKESDKEAPKTLNSNDLEGSLKEQMSEIGIVPKEKNEKGILKAKEMQEKTISRREKKPKKKNKTEKGKALFEKKENNKKSGEKIEEKGVEIGSDSGEIDENDQKQLEKIGLIGENEICWIFFLEDEFLIRFFRQLFIHSSEMMQLIVIIGCLINEIGHRMEVIDKLYPIGDKTLLNDLKSLGIAPSKWLHKKLGHHWHQIRNEQMPKVSPLKSDRKTEELRNILWKHLKTIAKFVDVNLAGANYSNESGKDETEFGEKQIIFRKMALALFSEREKIGKMVKNLKFGRTNSGQLEVLWDKVKFDDEEREKLTTTAFFRNEFELEKFNEFFGHFLLMTQQIEQDQKLYNEMSNFTKTENQILGNFGISLHLQEIKSFTGQKHLVESDSATINMLTEFLSKNGFGMVKNERKLKIDLAIEMIELMVKEWNPQAKLLVAGSYQLGVLTEHSDIDAICVGPAFLEFHFFGSEKCKIHRSRRSCPDWSLYCRLCLLQNVNVNTIRSIEDALVPLIKFTFQFDQNTPIDFDIGLVTFDPKDQIFKSKMPIKYEQSNALSAKIAKEIGELSEQRKHFGAGEVGEKSIEEKLKKKLRSLSSFEVSSIILKRILATENAENGNGNILQIYRIFLLMLKFWAREHHIYDNKLGFFNGISLSLLVAKVMLLYPMASLPFLIEKFFFTFSTWPWPTPVKLTDLPSLSILRWNASDESGKRQEIYSRRGLMPGLTMPIVTPGHIEQNATFNVNRSTATIIRREIQNAIKIIRNWPMDLENLQEEKWENLLKNKKFEEKFSHFIRINCKAFALADFYDFCGYVETRIRLQLLIDVERFDRIRLAHAKQIVEKGQILGENEKGDENEAFPVPKR
ncbi:hypothetical protein niasHS_011747 [Heterodera schachtii]|uniref:polynucleotide adenylyltransferase n=1 Tax=Heterodera schachtii TaxID=97005 RepID=A0ABD2IBT4_HETSC